MYVIAQLLNYTDLYIKLVKFKIIMSNNNIQFKAFRIHEIDRKYYSKIELTSLTTSTDKDVIIKVHYSALNYKDALSASGNKGVTKNYPHTPGIDAVGVIHISNSKLFNKGDKVIVTSYDLGMNTDGGFGEYIKVPAEWVIKLPENLTMKEAMILGTAGLTAGISILNLTKHIKPEDGKIAVSGATGGVGSTSIAILNKLGYTTVAITSKTSERDYLHQLGASEIILRNDFENLENKPLLKPLFSGAIDTVGGTILENIIKSTKYSGVITCCGNAASQNLNLTVFPFILRGIRLIGIDSQNLPMEDRIQVWNKLVTKWKPTNSLRNFQQISLNKLQENIDLMLKGKLKGRTLVKIIS